MFERDNGDLAIQRLDDPKSVEEAYPEESPFESDFAAYVWVKEQAQQGSEYHTKAIEMVRVR